MENMTVGQWLITFLLLNIPCVNLIMLFVWALGNNGYPARKTFAQAALIFGAICLVLGIILYAIFGAAMFAALSSTGAYFIF